MVVVGVSSRRRRAGRRSGCGVVVASALAAGLLLDSP